MNACRKAAHPLTNPHLFKPRDISGLCKTTASSLKCKGRQGPQKPLTALCLFSKGTCRHTRSISERPPLALSPPTTGPAGGHHLPTQGDSSATPAKKREPRHDESHPLGVPMPPAAEIFATTCSKPLKRKN